MFLCLRFDLDYVPWDASMADEFGHGEPSIVLRLLDFARFRGLKFHFFISGRSLRAFPTAADAILGEGHDLDWLCTDPSSKTYAGAMEAFGLAGHKPLGMAIDLPRLPEEADWLTAFEFATCPPSLCPSDLRCFPTALPSDRDAVRTGSSIKSWAEEVQAELKRTQGGLVVCLHPAVLSKHDSGLKQLESIYNAAARLALPVKTLRDIFKDGQ